MSITEKLSITELPTSTIDVACDHIAQYTVAMNRVFRRDGKPDSQLVGTGTLVNIEGLDCILTADHVLEVFAEPERLSLMSSFKGEPRGHEFALSHLGIHRIARGPSAEAGPDVGLIVLPQQSIGALRSEKIFYNVNRRSERFAGTYLPRDHGFWFNCGLIGETEKALAPLPNVPNLKGYEGLCGASANPTESDDGVFDYLEVRVDYGGRTDLPGTFGGMSGGGLWQVLLRKTASGIIEPEDYILSGVTFFQTAVEQKTRRLRCHGRKTVYECVPAYVRENITGA
jgi:hypothetical protein